MDNAAQMAKEARLLLDNGYHARAFGLAVLAREEAGKAFMCAQWAGRRPFPARHDQWQEFWSHFRNHVTKYVRALHYDWPEDWGWDEAALKELGDLATERQTNKWWAFYVDYQAGSVSVPVKLDPESCRAYVEQAEAFLGRVLEGDRKTSTETGVPADE